MSTKTAKPPKSKPPKATATLAERFPAVNGVRRVAIELPACAPDPDSYIASSLGRINTRLDQPEQLHGLRQLHAGLRESNATLNSGRPVDGPADVLRWLFERIDEALRR